MYRAATFLAIAISLFSVDSALGQNFSWSALESMDRQLTGVHQGLESHKTDYGDEAESQGWILRSNHFVFGMPRLVDRRHDFTPAGQEGERTGITVLVREGFVVAHFDRMRVPLFVCQRWTKADYYRMKKIDSQPRPWKEDLEVPSYARAGTWYDFQDTKMQRGHMARHADNRAWGEDNSAMGCRMSNSAPQHVGINMGAAWRGLEDALQEKPKDDEDIDVIWTISGTIFRDEENPDDELPEEDFEDTEFVGGGFGKPKATYKVVGWFAGNGYFQARGYVFEQEDRDDDIESYITPIDEIEERTGVDFFPMLKDYIEELIEKKQYNSMWGSS